MNRNKLRLNCTGTSYATCGYADGLAGFTLFPTSYFFYDSHGGGRILRGGQNCIFAAAAAGNEFTAGDMLGTYSENLKN